ncbi:hypothetical protein FZEAL_4090 [Fusarium zealandicum]|uniref:C2H2-type domain-containing protein n=1 Tax=Fusarium zealandicum TaxID=1053134 RepID=A0A8H4UN96_9HYPO|nr:hypothetical protein FZEAL_4090 [Fusarium zealandicum]
MTGPNIRSRGRSRKCAYCERVFTKEEHLRRHQRAHHDNRRGSSDQARAARRTSLDVIVVGDCNTSSEDERILMPTPERSKETPDRSIHALHQHSLHIQPVLPPVASPTLTSHSQVSPPQDLTMPDADIGIPPTEPQRLDASPGGNPNVDQVEDGGIMQRLAAGLIPRGGSEPWATAKSASSRASSDLSPSNSIGKRDQVPSPSPEDIGNGQQESPMPCPSEAVPQTFASQLDMQLASGFQQEEDFQQGGLGDNDDFDMFSCGLDPTSLSSDLPVDFNAMDCLDFGGSSLSLFLSATDHASTNSGLMPVSTRQMQHIQRVWSRQRPKKATRLVKRLWNQVVLHKADNIFTTPKIPCQEPLPPTPTMRCSMDAECRDRLMRYCKELDDSSSPSSPASSIKFPVVEILDSSLDFFFQFFHPILPFMHRSTFDARNTPSSLLLAMCLVGLSYLDRTPWIDEPDAKFVCLENDSNVSWRHHIEITQPMRTIRPADSSWLLVDRGDEIDECQAYLLCAQMLRTADKHGLFAANQDDDLAFQLGQASSDPDGFWKAWARVESVKRLIFCLTWLDMAYARLVNTAGVIEIDKMELHLPCDDDLFDGSTTAASFLHAIQQGAKLTMPRMNVLDLRPSSASILNDNSAQILLRMLYLRVLTARTRLLDEGSQCWDMYSLSPVEALALDADARSILTDVLLLPSTHASVLKGRNRMNALGWNYLCITLTANVDLLEAAAGRDGVEAAAAALVHVEEWSRSPSARRAVLHAAQVFDILDSSRIRESHLTRPDLVLFVSALVISQYLLVSGHKTGCPSTPTFELLQPIDWAVLRDEGLGTATGSIFSGTLPEPEQGPASSSAARHFLRHGGLVSFAGELQKSGDVAARKMARKFAHLMGGFGNWDGCSYSQLLEAICGSMSEHDGGYYEDV